jgi:hypothetical protein
MQAQTQLAPYPRLLILRMPPPKGYFFWHGFLLVVVLTLSLLKYMTTSIFVFGMTPRCCKVAAMYFMLGESPNEGPNDHIWLHNCQANLCMFLRFSNFLWERESERSWPAPKLWNQYHFEVRIIKLVLLGVGVSEQTSPLLLESWSMFHQNF